MRKSPSKNQATAYAFIIGVYGNGLVSSHNRFEHNLIHDTDEAGFLISGYGFTEQAKSHRITNNIMLNTGQSPYGNAYDVGTGIVVYQATPDGVGTNNFRNNLIYSDQAQNGLVYMQDDGSYYTVDEINAMEIINGIVFKNNLGADPLLSDVNNGNFFPLATSPVINNGFDVGHLWDYDLNPRVIGSAPDIGPFETSYTNAFFEQGGLPEFLVEQKEEDLNLARLDDNTLRILSGGHWDLSNVELKIFDLGGKLCFSQKGLSEIDITNLPYGSYFILIENNGSRKSLRFVK